MHDTQRIQQEGRQGEIRGQSQSRSKQLEESIPSFDEKTKERFFSKIKKTQGGCWPWTFCTADGYGVFRMTGGFVRAHRVSWILHFGPIPIGDGPHGTCVLHICDNRRCCNPDHLVLGTHSENMRQRDEKNRQPQGRKLSVAIKKGIQKRKIEKSNNN